MILARKESTYIDEQTRKGKQPEIRKKKRKNRRFEKTIATIIIVAVFACSILILMRFTVITEARNNVNNLEKQLEELETEKAKLKVDVEKALKSGWIESEAKIRLEMDYPTTEQIIGITVDSSKVAMLNSEINKTNHNGPTKSKDSGSRYGLLKRLVSYIKI